MWKFAIAGMLVALATAAATYAEYGYDVRTPRSSLIVAGVVGGTNKISAERYRVVAAAMREKYGDFAEIGVGGNVVRTTVNGALVHSEKLPLRYAQATGLTWIGKSEKELAAFPFQINLDGAESADGGFFLPHVQGYYGHLFKRRYLADLRENDFSFEPCRNFAAADLNLGVGGSLLKPGNSALCSIGWNRVPIARMVVGAVTADGGPWIRPFAHGACRILAQAWLEKLRKVEPGRTPQYLQCILADRPKRATGAATTAIYEVRRDGTLALAQSR